MAKYSLLYFNVNGRAAGIRLMLDYLKVPFEDKTFTFSEWPEIKPTTPFGQVPVLYVDGDEFVLPETLSIYRYLATKHGAIANSVESQVLCDAYGDHVKAYRSKIGRYMKAMFHKKSEEQANKYLADARQYLHERLIPDLKKQLDKNGTGWMVGDKPTWLDFYVADVVDNHLHWNSEDKEKIPEILLKHRDRVFGLPGLEKRVEERKHLFPPKDMFSC